MSRPVPNAGILDIAPYTPGKRPRPQPGRKVFKLSANETPFGPSPKAIEAYINAAAHLQDYPESTSRILREAIGRAFGLDPNRIVCGAGSDDLLNLLARAYLQDRPTQPVSLPEVGAVAGVTVSHLVRSFSRAVGLPPKSYHAQIRLARARRLLGQGKSATWVAYECGFADQSHLSRRFKQCYGLTPGAFQAQYRQERAAASNAA